MLNVFYRRGPDQIASSRSEGCKVDRCRRARWHASQGCRLVSSASAVPNAVILSGAGKHGRSRRTSNILRVLVAEPMAAAAVAGESHESREWRKCNSCHSSDSLALPVCVGTSAPLKNPLEVGGPSTPPMIPRSAQDDRDFGDGACARNDTLHWKASPLLPPAEHPR